mgnify:CR=1 FL=1
MLSRRRAGVLLHISSLPNEYGIGSLGKEAFNFIDFLRDSGMSYWQFLPLNAVYADPSPYASISSTGYNIYLISLERLIDYGLLKKDEIEILKNDGNVDFETLFPLKRKVLKEKKKSQQRKEIILKTFCRVFSMEANTNPQESI